MRLRPYQDKAVESVHAEFQTVNSTLLVLPTGTGKTVVFSEVIARENRRAIVIAHREELIWQAASKIKQITGEEPGIEMAEYRASVHGLYGKHRVVVSSVQTLNAGNDGAGRMCNFDPNEFGLMVIDEAHHATAASYRRAIEHFRKNPNLKILGVTATPDRADEAALGQVFESVAFDYEIVDAIHDGWLVPIETRAVVVDGLDLSEVRTTAGDLNGADLSRVMEYEQNLHEIAHPTLDITKGRKTLVFATSVAHAERLAEIFNRHENDCARWVCGETPKENRRAMFADFAAGKFRLLVNVGVATEGFDDPGIEVVAIARPTKSRSLYAQMVGRGTRPLPGIVDRTIGEGLFEWGAAERLAAIAGSKKPRVEILDFVGNSGRHKLVTCADILGGNHDDAVIERAKAKAEKGGKPKNMLEALDEAEEELRQEREEARRREEADRTRLRLKAKYVTAPVDAFDVFGIAPPRERGWDTGRQPSQKMLALLEKQGIDTSNINFTQARALISEITGRWDKGLCSMKQARILQRAGYPTDVSREEASKLIDQIFQKQRRIQKTPVNAAIKVY